MTKMDKPSAFSRRALLKGAVVVSVGAPLALDTLLSMNAAQAQGSKPPLMPDQLSSYIAINADGTVSAFFGKMDMGHGLFVAIGQMVAEELDVPFKAVTVFMGDTATSVNQGGASGSTGIQLGGRQMRMAAAEARRVLVEMAAAKLGTPADQLIVVNGVVSAAFNRDKKTSYAELIGGRYFNVQLDWNKQWGNPLYAPGKAQPKPHTAHKIVGQSIKREDVAPKVFCQEDYCTDIKVPGMVHGRVIRPAVAGAVPVKVDESSIKDIPGVKVVWEKDFLGLVAENEWNAIKAADKLKVEWSNAAPSFPETAGIYDHIRKAPVRKRDEGKPVGNVDDAFRVGGARGRGRIRVAVPVACQHGTGLRAGRDQGRAGDLLDRLAEIPLRARRRRRHAGAAARQGAGDLGAGPRRLRPQRCGRCRDGRGGARESHRTPGSPAIHARSGHRLGPQGAGLDPSRACRDRRRRQRHRLRFPQQGLLAHRRADEREQGGGHAGRPSARREADGE